MSSCIIRCIIYLSKTSVNEYIHDRYLRAPVISILKNWRQHPISCSDPKL